MRPCFLSPRVAAGRRDELAGSSLCRGCSAAAEDSETLFNVQVTPKSTLSRLSAVRNGQVESTINWEDSALDVLWTLPHGLQIRDLGPQAKTRCTVRVSNMLGGLLRLH